MSEYSDNLAVADVEAITPAPQPEVATPTAQEAVLREIIDWCHLQPGNYPNWMDRARQAVGDFEGDPGPPPQPSEAVSVSEALKPFADMISYIEADTPDDYHPSWAEFLTVGDFRRAATALRALKGDDANG